jgi:hypothetical protein
MVLGRHDLRGYEWKVIVDSTRGHEDPGLFYGRLFRMMDFVLERDEKSTWPNGIVFEHTLTGNRLTFAQGRLVDLTHSKILGRKPKIRRRTHSASTIQPSGGKPLNEESNSISHRVCMRRFVLVRVKDLTGVTGTGIVAEGTVFTDGRSVIRWLREPHSMGIYQSLNDVITVHGHEGGTRLHFIDEGEIALVSEGDAR